MRQIRTLVQSAVAGVTSLTWSALAFAQQQAPSANVTVTTKTTEVWYTNWWVWAAAIAVFLIVVIALTNRGGSRT